MEVIYARSPGFLNGGDARRPAKPGTGIAAEPEDGGATLVRAARCAAES